MTFISCFMVGARNCFDVISEWPSYTKAMKGIRNTILHFRKQHESLQQLAEVCGPNAKRTPPSDDLIRDLRHRVARK